MSGERCGHPTKGGDPCPTPIALCSSCGRCRSHCRYDEACDYDAEDVRASRAKGAKRKAEKARDDGMRTVMPDDAPPPPESLDDAVLWASWAIAAVATGRIDGRTAHEVGYLLRAYMKGLDKAELGERVEELESKLAELRRQDMGAV